MIVFAFFNILPNFWLVLRDEVCFFGQLLLPECLWINFFVWVIDFFGKTKFLLLLQTEIRRSRYWLHVYWLLICKLNIRLRERGQQGFVQDLRFFKNLFSGRLCILNLGLEFSLLPGVFTENCGRAHVDDEASIIYPFCFSFSLSFCSISEKCGISLCRGCWPWLKLVWLDISLALKARTRLERLDKIDFVVNDRGLRELLMDTHVDRFMIILLSLLCLVMVIKEGLRGERCTANLHLVLGMGWVSPCLRILLQKHLRLMPDFMSLCWQSWVRCSRRIGLHKVQLCNDFGTAIWVNTGVFLAKLIFDGIFFEQSLLWFNEIRSAQRSLVPGTLLILFICPLQSRLIGHFVKQIIHFSIVLSITSLQR